ncbi:MAG: AtpZ/AtpI family protein [Gemmatimonadota bacterium]
MPDRRSEEQRTLAREAGAFLGIGIQFAGSIILFLFAGKWLDERLGTEPWLLLLGVFVGAAAGFYSLYRQLVIAPRERAARRRGE